MPELNEQYPLGEFPLGSHDSWQYHFYAPELERFFSIRMWTSGSVRQAWAWTAVKSNEINGSFSQSSITYLDNCRFDRQAKQTTSASQPGQELRVTFEELDNKTHAGVLTVSLETGPAVLTISIKPGSVHFWHVPGQADGVFHFPDISAEIAYEGRTVHAFGYCKRYWGDYDGPWGYQFIQGMPESENVSIWTADATFGDNEYNYFKISEYGKLLAAERVDTWHNKQRAFWRPLEGPKMEVKLREVAKTEFILKSDKMYSKLVERFGLVELTRDGEVVFSGFGFNEICFGTVA